MMTLTAIETEKDLHLMGDTYIKVNDALPEHRKIVAAGGDAAWLHVCALAYSSRNLTDGRIPAGVVPRLSDRKQPAKLAKKLTEVRLWHAAGHDCKRCPQPSSDEYVIHDYLIHQRSAEHVEAIKKKRAEAGRQGGSKKATNAKQGASNLLDGCKDDVEANGTPEAEEVLRTSQAETETEEPLPPPAGADAQGVDLVLVEMDASKPKKPRKARVSKVDRTPLDDLADELTNGYWDRYASTTAHKWISVRQIILTALENGAARNDIARSLDAMGRGRKPVTANILTFTLGEVERAREQRAGSPPIAGAVDRKQQATNDLFDRALERAAAREEAS